MNLYGLIHEFMSHAWMVRSKLGSELVLYQVLLHIVT